MFTDVCGDSIIIIIIIFFFDFQKLCSFYFKGTRDNKTKIYSAPKNETFIILANFPGILSFILIQNLSCFWKLLMGFPEQL